MNISALVYAVTITFSPFAAIIAYIITYDEYQHHVNQRQARKQALHMAVFTFIVFIIIGIVSGIAFSTFVIQ